MSESPLVRIRDVHKFYTRGAERTDVLKGVTGTRLVSVVLPSA